MTTPQTPSAFRSASSWLSASNAITNVCIGTAPLRTAIYAHLFYAPQPYRVTPRQDVSR